MATSTPFDTVTIETLQQQQQQQHLLLQPAGGAGGFLHDSLHSSYPPSSVSLKQAPFTFVDVSFSTTVSKQAAKASKRAHAEPAAGGRLSNTGKTSSAATVVDSESLRNLASNSPLPLNESPLSPPPRPLVAGSEKILLEPVTGQVFPGQMLAVMGPSGAGKTTLLDALARRLRGAKGDVFLGDRRIDTTAQMATVGSYVEQEDDLLSLLTVRETIMYAAILSDPKEKAEVLRGRVEHIINAMGLAKCANVRIGNPIQKGISGGQKRRVTIAQSLVTNPRILFLDEPTSGLDTTTSREVMTAIKRIAKDTQMIVIATIHQPNFETLRLFDSFAPDHAIDLVNADFELATESNIRQSIVALAQFYQSRTSAAVAGLRGSFTKSSTTALPLAHATHRSHFLSHTLVLSHRIFITYTRNFIAYGVRVGMYFGMGVMMALIWLKLGSNASTVNDRLSVHFFSVAFLSFMSVAGIPAFLEERSVFIREKHNGLYTALPYVLANSLVNIPFLFLCALVFAAIAYYSIGLNAPAGSFFSFIAYLFLAIYAAESQVILVASLLPIFVAALAIASFANGFWMCVQGYFIKAISLPRFWRYSFHYMDYQKYAFELLVNNDFTNVVFDCGRDAAGNCLQCSYPSSAPVNSCQMYGEDVLAYLEIGGIKYWEWIVILVGISILFRVCWYAVLARSK
ncbi:P-loop containing nucleoside triphosphate hydrolase protein [Zopfochytrium polystomum]|nr:P-loop containing nucleoside triphosphate hydrolase protein [Zopfochytrium polystomum]